MRMEAERLVAESPAELLQLAAEGGEPPISPRVRALARSRRRLRQRALADALMLTAGVAAAPLLFTELPDRLLAGIAAAGAALVVFLARRDQDLAAAAEAARAARHAMDGRGISLSEWHAGAELPAWAARPRPRD